MTNEKKLENLTNPTFAKISFGWKDFEVKRLSIEAVLKIASIIGWMSWNSLIDVQKEKINLAALSSIDWDEINDLIALILRTKKEEVVELFNITDFLKLVKIIIQQEDIKNLFLEVSQLTEAVTAQAEL